MSPEKKDGEKPDRIARITALAAAVTAVLGAASDVTHLPRFVLYVLALIAAAMLASSLYRIQSVEKLRSAAVALSVVAVGLSAYALQNVDPQTGQTFAAETSHSSPPNTAALTSGITPSDGSSVPTCVAVSGQGQIPAGYEIWVANTNSTAEGPDTSEFFNITRATEVPGGDSWATGKFGIGETEAAGKQYWIYVLLVPNSNGVVLDHTFPGETNLSSLMPGWSVIHKIPVLRTAQHTC